MNWTLFFLLVVLLSGCSATQSSSVLPPFEGATTADQTLQRDGFTNAAMFAGFSGCSTIDRVIASIVSVDDESPLSAKVVEKWVLLGCGREFPFIVSMNGDGEGGTFIAVQKDY